jgi:diguanylate cyclase (GGDEF)-like protein
VLYYEGFLEDISERKRIEVAEREQRGLIQWGEREVERALHFQRPLAVVMLDIDYFKGVNDTYGHLAGDRVLRALAACFHAHVRRVDVIARYGGEEFILLLTETDLVSAAEVAERVRGSVEALRVPAEPDEGPVGGRIRVTASLGVVSLTPDTPDLTDLLRRVDLAM